MLVTLRHALIVTALAAVFGCAPNEPAPQSNPWGQPNSANSAYISELMRRADQQNQLAQNQRKQIEELQKMQAQQQKYNTDYLARQRANELAALEKQYAAKESNFNSRYESLRGRASDLDSNNRDLHARLASAEQRRELLEDEVDLLKRRLRETTEQLSNAQRIGRETDQQLRTLQASATQRQGQASIRANSSQRTLTAVSVQGLDIRQDGDLVRISTSADKLFMAGSASLHRGSQPFLDQIARVIQEHYPQQIVGIEAHSDTSTFRHASHRAVNQHRLTADQSLAVLDQLAARNIDRRQLFVIGHGANHPLVSSGTVQGQSMNQRVEVVIYPETVAR